MGYARGRFGVEYQPHRQQSEGHPLLWFVVVVVLLVSGAFTYYRFTRGSNTSSGDEHSKVDRPTPEDGKQAPSALTVDKQTPDVKSIPTSPAHKPQERQVPPVVQSRPRQQPPSPAPPPPPPPNPNADRVREWLRASSERPSEDCVRLERLLEAEIKGSPALAADAIKKLYGRATMADLQDPLLRRLGELNLQILFSGQNNPLVTTVTAKRGDSRDRIARENRTTTAVIVKLNPKIKWEKLKPGDAVRVLFVPSPTLVIYRKRGYADLSLKGGVFFNRYDIAVKKTAQNGTYPISSETSGSVRARFRELGINAQKRAEIEMFLAPGARIIVADQ